MPRPLWAGAISFGLVTIPVKIVSATEDHDVHFHRVHLADTGRVRTQKVCELDGQVVSQDETGKGYEVSTGETVTVTDEELEQMPLPTAKESRGEDHDGDEATVHEMRPAKKTGGRTAPAKKKAASSKTAAAKKTTARSTSAAKKGAGKRAPVKKRSAS